MQAVLQVSWQGLQRATGAVWFQDAFQVEKKK
jgi:hypothetical protein